MKYAGIGSRRAPMDILARLRDIAKYLEEKGYEVHTGGALGCDKAFIDGSTNSVLWLPWDGYNGYHSDNDDPSYEALKMASKFHPAWNNCKRGARNMHARNCNIVLGESLKDPVDFIVCWTPNGEIEGGTGQALRLADYYGIRVFNLGKNPDSAVERLKNFVENGAQECLHSFGHLI